MNEFAARFPSAVAAAMCVFLVYWCGRRLWDRAAGFVAALIMASSVGFLAFARAASMDMPLTACLTAALVFLLVAENATQPSRRWWFYLFYASLGLGVLAKGPIALVLPAFRRCAFWSCSRQMARVANVPSRVEYCIALAVALPWYIACTWMNGCEFIRVFIINHNFERFTIHVFTVISGPFYFYFPVLLLLTFPWTFLLISGGATAVWSKRTTLAVVGHRSLRFLFIIGIQTAGYILPMVPPIALLLAKEMLSRVPRLPGRRSTSRPDMMAFIGVAFWFLGKMLNVDPHVSGEVIMTVSFVMAAVLIVIALWLDPAYLAGFHVIAMAALVITATTMVFPRFDLTDTMRPWNSALASLAPSDQTVLMYKPTRWAEYGLQYYRQNRIQTVFSPDELAEAVRSSRGYCALPKMT